MEKVKKVSHKVENKIMETHTCGTWKILTDFP